MVTELSLDTGGHFQVYVLQHDDDDSLNPSHGRSNPDSGMRHTPTEMLEIIETWTYNSLKKDYSRVDIDKYALASVSATS